MLNQPVCVAEVNILKLYLPLLVKKIASIDFILHLRETRR